MPAKGDKTYEKNLSRIELILGRNRSRLEKHVNKRIQQSWRRNYTPIRKPLVKYEQNQISKDGHQECDLGNKLGINTPTFAKVKIVVNIHDNPKRHLHHAENDGHFHLVRVGKEQIIVRSVPSLN